MNDAALVSGVKRSCDLDCPSYGSRCWKWTPAHALLPAISPSMYSMTRYATPS